MSSWSNPNPNLKTTLSTLKSLIDLSSQSTKLLSSIPCPSIPHHNIPSSSSSSSTFFYQNCPSVVSLPNPPTLTLPHFLSTCTHKAFCQSSHFRFLASEYMFLIRETHCWNHYPSHYSCIIRRVLLCLGSCGMPDVSTWIIVNSPRYGLTIDVSLSGHVLLLLRFCLSPIVSEAIALGNGHGDDFFFRCPVFCQVFRWFGTQLAILFGEINANLFAIHLFRHLILNVTIKFLMFTGETSEIKINDFFTEGEISVSQVEDAVAVFRDRSLLEQKIKALRYSRQLNCSQRYASSVFIACIILYPLCC